MSMKIFSPWATPQSTPTLCSNALTRRIQVRIKMEGTQRSVRTQCLVKSLKLLGNQTGGFRALQCIVWWSLHTVSTKEIFRGNCYWESYSSVTMEGIMKFLCLAPKLHLHITHSDKTERKSFLLYIYLKGFPLTFPFSYISFGCVSVSV